LLNGSCLTVNPFNNSGKTLIIGKKEISNTEA